MKRLSDRNLVNAALNIYAKHLRGLENPSAVTQGNIKRVEELRAHCTTDDLIITEKDVIHKMDDMCASSLDPIEYESWEIAKKGVENRRKNVLETMAFIKK